MAYTSEYSGIEIDERLKNTNIVVGKSGNVDFLTTDYASDDLCVQAAINSAASSGISEIIIKDGTYTFADNILISSNIKIYGSGNPVFTWNVLNKAMIYAKGAANTVITCTANIQFNTNIVTVSDPTGIVKGDLILIYDNTLWTPGEDGSYGTWKIGELHEVLSVSGNIITFADQTLHGYTTANSASVIQIKPITVTIDGIEIQGAGSTVYSLAIYMQYCSHSKIRNCKLNNLGVYGISVDDCYNTDISNCTISNCEYTGLGYGVTCSNAVAHVHVHENKISACRHCHASGGSTSGIGLNRDLRVYNNSIFGGSAWAIDAHALAESLYVYDNDIHTKWDCAVVSGAKYTVVNNNKIYGGMGTGIRGGVQDIIYEVKDNTFYNTGYIFSDSVAYSAANHTEKLVVAKGNTVIGATSTLFQSTKATTVDIFGNNIDSDVSTDVDVVTSIDTCTAATGWAKYSTTGGTLTEPISVVDGRIKIVGHPSDDGKLCITKTFSAAIPNCTYVAYSIESNQVGYPRFSIYDASANSKTWGKTVNITPNINNKYSLPLNAPLGEIGPRPTSISTSFLIDSVTRVIVGMYGLPDEDVTFYIDNIYARTGTTDDTPSIYVENATDGNISNNIIKNSYSDGIYTRNCSGLLIDGNSIDKSNRANLTGEMYESGISISSSSNNTVINNSITDSDSKQVYAIKEYGTSNLNYIKNNNVSGALTAQISKLGAGTIVENNPGFNPKGNFTAPAVPASTVAYTNTYGYPCTVYISGGTVTNIARNGILTGLTSGEFTIPIGGTIAITYTVAPTWKWFGL